MRTVRVTHTPQGVELFFPPMRMPEVAAPLALFGIIATAVPAITVAALLPSLGVASGLLSAVLVAAFVLPFGIFGMAFVILALYMVANALRVRIEGETIDTVRLLFGCVVRRHHVVRNDVGSLEPKIASRYQSLFSADPVYRLVAIDTLLNKRVVVAETLEGEAQMQQVKALIENPASRT